MDGVKPVALLYRCSAALQTFRRSVVSAVETDLRIRLPSGFNGSNVVYLTCAAYEGNSRARVLFREHKQVYKSVSGTNTRGDIKGPPLAWEAIGECSSDYRS